ncbi:DUF7112 family protein [Halarchaeum nitratireducens]|uniref:Uncharacterized protein n=1 Tax=Halarchaeum nitratireducens TaxID=489913 RepID=A0A830GDI4_9EURY|nr:MULTISPECIES: hypothetical protein [Halarchaeum]MBP2250792.1 hypothetical protein [Halarchaeum solikamskense]GGN18963.1 hypothetical protein GCM10009021_20050 [Halarchaeum nitratireducens]
MVERVTSEGVRTVDTVLERYGSTNRPQLRVTDSDAVPVGEVVRLAVDDAEYRTRVAEDASGSAVLRGAFESPRLARTPGEGENHLRAWLHALDLDYGRTIHLDVVTSDYKYGVRAPGERATYAATEAPDDGLASIARDLDG